MKIAIVILSDPDNGDDALGRVFNALLLAQEGLRCGSEIEIIFSGPGTRWPAQLTRLTHPANGVYNAVRAAVKGASYGCAALYDATAGVTASGVPLLRDQALEGTDGVANLHRYLAEGWTTLIF